MQVLHQLPILNSRNLLVGAATGDDAGVYRIDRNRALVQTTGAYGIFRIARPLFPEAAKSL